MSHIVTPATAGRFRVAGCFATCLATSVILMPQAPGSFWHLNARICRIRSADDKNALNSAATMATLGPDASAETKESGHSPLGKKTLSYFAGLVLVINGITGPGVLHLRVPLTDR